MKREGSIMATTRYNRYEDFDFSAFEPKQSSYERNAARKLDTAPRRSTQTKKQPEMKLVEKPKMSYAQAKANMHFASLQSAKILTISLVLLVLMSALLYGRMKVDELDRQIQNTKSELSVAQSENVRLNMKLDSMISLKNVEEYAQTNLGMVKMESHQIEYIDLSGENKANVSGSKTLKKTNDKKEHSGTKFLAYKGK